MRTRRAVHLAARRHIAQELFVQVLGLPLSSLIVLIVIPLGLIAYQVLPVLADQDRPA